MSDEQGGLAAGTQVYTADGVVIIDSDGALGISASGASPELAQRTRLVPADPARPQVLYLGEGEGEAVGEAALLEALRSGKIDAIARGTVGNTQAAAADGDFAVTALDEAPEHGGFAVDAADTALLDKMNTAVAWLTDNGRIGIRDWLANPQVFADRAHQWKPDS